MRGHHSARRYDAVIDAMEPPRFEGDYAIAVLGDLYCEQGRERGASSNGRWARRWLLVARGEDARERLVSGQTHRP